MENNNDDFKVCVNCGEKNALGDCCPNCASFDCDICGNEIDFDGDIYCEVTDRRMCDECAPRDDDAGATHVAAAGMLGFLWRKGDFDYLWHTACESFYLEQQDRFELAIPCETFEREKFHGHWWLYWYRTKADALLAREIAQNRGEIAYLLHDSSESFFGPALLTTMGEP